MEELEEGEIINTSNFRRNASLPSLDLFSDSEESDTEVERKYKRKAPEPDQSKSKQKKQRYYYEKVQGSTYQLDPVPIDERIFAGEQYIPPCTSAKDSILIVYQMLISPQININSKNPTIIQVDGLDFVFDGFTILSHKRISVPPITFSRSGVEYTVTLREETQKPAKEFDFYSISWIFHFLFETILQLKGWLPSPKDKKGHPGCHMFHFIPRFMHNSTKGKLVLREREIEKYFREAPKNVLKILNTFRFQNSGKEQEMARDSLVDQIVTTYYSGPAFRVDDIAFDKDPLFRFNSGNEQISYRRYFDNRGYKIEDLKQPLLYHYIMLGHNHHQEGLHLVPELCQTTGLKSDVLQWGVLLPSTVYHIRIFTSLEQIETKIGFIFKDKNLLKIPFIHPSHSEIYGMEADKARDAYSRVGALKKKVYINQGKREIFEDGNNNSTGENISHISHNQRLEFLGDAVLEFIVTSHLYLMFPEENEGSLTQYRSGLVNNKLLTHFALQLELDKFLLHDSTINLETNPNHRILADCFEALLGALFLDQGIGACRQFYAKMFFNKDESQMLNYWLHPPPDPATSESEADLRTTATGIKLQELQDSLGVHFTCQKMLMRAFTHSSIKHGLDPLNVGSNQLLEFLGDAVLQFICSQYLYLSYPTYSEGQLTLIRSALVNNKVIAGIALELGFERYVRYLPSDDLTDKSWQGIISDLFEAFLGCLYLDKDLAAVETFLRVSLLSRTKEAILKKKWMDPKTKLQQRVLSIVKNRKYSPVYKVLQEVGPAHLRVYTVGVFLLNQKIGEGNGQSKQLAEQNAAQEALSNNNWQRLLRNNKS